MSKDQGAYETFMCILFVIWTVAFVMIGGATTKSRIHKEAVEQGHAHWVVDDSGDTTFKWNKHKDCNEKTKAKKTVR